MEQSGKTLSMTGDARWKGTATHNASLLKIHDNSYTTGYSKITPAVGVLPKFGFGCWYDAALKNNQVFCAMPAGVGAKPVFAGILARQPHIATGYPARNDTVDEHNKGLLVKDGYLIYKTGYTAAVEDLDFDDIEVGMVLAIDEEDGRFTFAAAAPADFFEAGVVIALNPDDKSWTVKLTFLG